MSRTPSAWSGRTMVRHAALVLAVVLAAFAGLAVHVPRAGSGEAAATTRLRTLRIALDWTPNVDYLGIAAAIANGDFTREGIRPEIIPYAGIPAETLLAQRKADLGLTYPPNIPAYRASGLHYRAVAGLTQTNTDELAVLGSSPYRSPAQLSGTLYGGFGVPSDPPIIETIMRDLGVAHPVFRQVVLNGSAYQALESGRVAYTSMFGGIDDITAELQGARLRTFPIRDYLGSAASFPNDAYVATDEEIRDDPSLLRHGLAALAQGYVFAAHDPAAAEEDLIRQNPTALAHSQNIIRATGNATAPTFLNAEGQWGTLTASQFSGITQLMAKAGLFHGRTPPPATDDFTDRLLPGS